MRDLIQNLSVYLMRLTKFKLLLAYKTPDLTITVNYVLCIDQFEIQNVFSFLW